MEKPEPGTAPSNYAVIGRYVLDPAIFPILESQDKGVGGEIQLTDALNKLAGENSIYGLVFDGSRHDAGDRLGLLKANIHYALKDEGLRDGLLEYMTEKLSFPGKER